MSALDAFEFVASDARVLDQRRYEWRGTTYRVQPGATSHIPKARGRSDLVRQLAQRIYDDAYSEAGVARNRTPWDGKPRDALFLDALAGTLPSRYAWQPGWRRVRSPDGKVLVERADGTRRLVRNQEWDPTNRRVRVPRGTSQLQPGWFHARGAVDHVDHRRPTTRLYWNVAAQGPVALTHVIVRAFDRLRVPLRFKVCADPERFDRADAAVAYFPREHWATVATRLPALWTTARPYLRVATPLFTLRLARGLAVADDPGLGESFGQHRCRLAAQGLADVSGRSTKDQRSSAIQASFRRAGLDPDRPHLGAGAPPLAPCGPFLERLP